MNYLILFVFLTDNVTVLPVSVPDKITQFIL